MTDARENHLRKLLNEIAVKEKYDNPDIETVAVPTTGANFSSQLFHGTIKSKDKKDLKFFAKVAVACKAMREQVGLDLFGVEKYFYTNLVRTYREIEEKHRVPEKFRLGVSEFYGQSNEYFQEVLVLQDLSKEGFVTHDRMKSFDWEYAASAVVELAKLHALSIAYQKEYPDNYEDAKNILKDWASQEDGDVVEMFTKSRDVAIKLVNEKNRGKLEEYFRKNKELKLFYGPRKRPVIAHGDFRMSNMLYKHCEDGKIQVIIVDYQTLAIGCGSVDLIYFIFSGSDGAFRAQYYDQLIEFYYENLAAALRRLDLDPAEAFPRADFDEELKEMLPFGLMMACMLMPVITADMAHIAKMEDEDYEERGLQTITNVIGKANELCAKRINEVVDDYVRWGII